MSINNEYALLRKKIGRIGEVVSNLDTIIHLHKMVAMDVPKLPKTDQYMKHYVLFRYLASVAFNDTSAVHVDNKIKAEKALCDIELRWAKVEYGKKRKIEQFRTIFYNCFDASFHGHEEKYARLTLTAIAPTDVPFDIPMSIIYKETDVEIDKQLDSFYIEAIRGCLRQHNDMLHGKYDGLSQFIIPDSDDDEDIDDVVARFKQYLIRR
jgi:hypothetical protein